MPIQRGSSLKKGQLSSSNYAPIKAAAPLLPHPLSLPGLLLSCTGVRASDPLALASLRGSLSPLRLAMIKSLIGERVSSPVSVSVHLSRTMY